MMNPVEILLVEDNPADAELTTKKMEKAKICNRVNVVENGAEALAFLRMEGAYRHAKRPDLILLDLNLPGMNGREVLKAIKSDKNLSTIPVVVLTSSEAEDDVVSSYQLHANAYVRKPVDFAGYQRIVQAIDGFWLGLVKYAQPGQ